MVRCTVFNTKVTDFCHLGVKLIIYLQFWRKNFQSYRINVNIRAFLYKITNFSTIT